MPRHSGARQSIGGEEPHYRITITKCLNKKRTSPKVGLASLARPQQARLPPMLELKHHQQKALVVLQANQIARRDQVRFLITSRPELPSLRNAPVNRLFHMTLIARVGNAVRRG